jgi:hypothetical protein
MDLVDHITIVAVVELSSLNRIHRRIDVSRLLQERYCFFFHGRLSSRHAEQCQWCHRPTVSLAFHDLGKLRSGCSQVAQKMMEPLSSVSPFSTLKYRAVSSTSGGGT